VQCIVSSILNGHPLLLLLLLLLLIFICECFSCRRFCLLICLIYSKVCQLNLNLLHDAVNRNSGFNVLPSRSLLSEQEYEYGFQRAARRIYGNSAEDDPGFPKEVFAIYLALSKHIKHVYEAGISLHEAASSGSSSAVLMLNEHWRAQNVCHYRSTKDVEEFYYDTLMQKAGAEQVFADQALSLERMRVCQDQHSRALASMNSLQTSSMPAPASIKKRPKFPGSKYHEDCKKAIKEMVLRNPFEFLFLKSVSKYILCFCSHPLCPLTGSTPAENVSTYPKTKS